jgi:FAD/FMN-containing dehydrogenase/Fe-S oxidoreductase
MATTEPLDWTTPVPSENAYRTEAERVASALRGRIRGEIRFEDGDRALYATDLSVYRQIPIGVVIPGTIDDVVETVAVCREHGVPVLPRGGGTSLAGQCCNVAVVIDFSKYLNNIVEYNPEERYAWVEPGVICDQLRHRAWEDHLTWAPDPATHAYNTFGGMIGNNSCGSHSVLGGKTVDNIEEMEILTYAGDRFTVGRVESEEELERIISEGGPRGELYRRLRDLRDRYADLIRARYPDIPRRVSGYNLDDLLPEKGFDVARALVGSEGTLAIVLKAKCRLVPHPPKRSLLVIGYDSMADAGDHVPELMELEPIALEGIHQSVPRNMEIKGRSLPGAELLPEGKMWLLVQFGGISQEEANTRAGEARRRIEERGGNYREIRLLGDADEVSKVWKVRESGVSSSRIAHKEAGWPCWEDSAVHPEKEGPYLRELEALLDRYGYEWTGYGHWGQGCFHIRINFDFGTEEGVRRYRSFMDEASDLVLKYNGSLSGEHGDGQARAEFLPKMFGEELIEAFREYKRIWDPDWKMNPGKLVYPYPTDTNLRVGPDYRPKRVKTHFRFPDDRGSMALATQRCFGVGKCRQLEGKLTMCPSFQVLREEKHTTRGRAHLLFEALRGDSPIGGDGWKSDYVKESLDLCLGCKGCKGDCPEFVDIATYKAEFISHYYEGRLRPRAAYAFGLIEWWAKLASLAPDASNLLTQTPGLDRVAKWVAGVAPERRIPAFAAQTFTQWWRDREPRNRSGAEATERAQHAKNEGRPEVILWADTFNNHFHPSVLQAGAEVLESAGYQVVVPQKWLPSSRPLYDWGMLDLAKWQLRRILDALRDEIRAGTPVVVLEPSEASVFRHELWQFFPDEQDAVALGRQTYTLAEFLVEQVEDWTPPRLEGKAITHVHCHHRAVMGEKAHLELLMKMGLEVDVPDPGCCGMAGPFGFEEGQKYDISVARGEQLLLPAVREASEETLIVVDGFSCREQIAQGTRRRALHLAEVLQMALQRPEIQERGRPEERYAPLRPTALARPTSPTFGALVLSGALLLGGVAVRGLFGGTEDGDGRPPAGSRRDGAERRASRVEREEPVARAPARREEEANRRARARRRELAAIAREM